VVNVDLVKRVEINSINRCVLSINLALIVSLRKGGHCKGELVRERLNVFIGCEGGQADIFVADEPAVITDIVILGDKAGKVSRLTEPDMVLMLLGEPAEVIER
jgi:hypothetical protein